MSTLFRFYGTTIGKKIVMAITGAIMLGFLCVHMVGNLQIFLPDKATSVAELNGNSLQARMMPALDAYGHLLKSMPALVWANRLVLALALTLHLISALLLTLRSWASRPEDYRQEKRIETTWAARSMRWGGVIIGVFILYHLLHFTVGTVHPDGAGFQSTEIRHNVLSGFSFWTVAAFYVAVMIVLGLHLWHGGWSIFQTLGLNHPNYNRLRRILASVLAIFIASGFLVIPAAVLLGWLR